MSDRSSTSLWSRARAWLMKAIRYVGAHELPTLVLLTLLVGFLWGFTELADEVLEGDTRSFDEQLLLMMRSSGNPADPLGPHWMEEIGRDFSALGGVGVLSFITTAVALALLLRGKWRAMLVVLAAVIGGVILSSLAKFSFDRPRPDLVPHDAEVYTASFPSGHSMMAAVTYLTLGSLLARVEPRLTLKVYYILLAGVLTFLVGTSRIYVGVHWPTDVLAGWTAGSAWAVFCWMVARWLQRRGQVEENGEQIERLPKLTGLRK